MSNGDELQVGLEDDRVEFSGNAFALWNLIIRPPRRRYDAARLGPKEFRLWSCGVKRMDVTLLNSRGMQIKCSHFVPVNNGVDKPEPRPVVIYLHANASCRLEALPLIPMFLPLGISLFAFDFAGCGESDGEYISLGWYERDDLAECVNYLRKTGMVSAIGLWGRSMGSVTALLHADRDHSIGGMVLDSPFASLRQLATELAQSDYLTVKVPSWLLSGALAVGRLRIKSLCNFDIDALAPERHVGASFVPAYFIAAQGDDFIAPHHTQRLYEAYTGDKELEMVEGDHNSPRCAETVRKAVLFFCRAFRCDPSVPRSSDGALARLLGFDALTADSSTEFLIVNRQLREEACRLLATAGGGRVWLGERQHMFAPLRMESALQLHEAQTEAGFCVCLFPLHSDWGGVNRPPIVLFAHCTSAGLRITRATEMEPEVLAEQPHTLELQVPILCTVEVRVVQPCLRLALGEGPALSLNIEEEYSHEILIWPMSKQGVATFFDVALTDLHPAEDEAPPMSRDVSSSTDAGRTESAGRGAQEEAAGLLQQPAAEERGTSSASSGAIAAGAIPTPVAPARDTGSARRESGMCNHQ
mmetsp:Transcript_71186/g.123539  ORF Transcript_71186/g.123539 Transcript_71186/m.123539 type:complete len:586 (-) Transcript_71186:47-1804(-)